MSFNTPNGGAQGPLVTETEAANLLCQSKRTLQKWRVIGYGPDHYKIGRNVRYRLDDLNAWINSRRRSHTSENGGQ
ncbi:hypothetical protein OAN307_c31460 [Octadecabacter antarcticus 307]|uniref:Helix-turn-helix domain-containing protein n=1 Tax=Octadecabacter antarcticus 307 TaxID=391626 RepID=M9RFS8_9RHOB|nr:helix-turn-helix domain-containing protein [Octadecabacter antarcticus]AGI68680.1 hypothetical protein OAN307_c31460 [Octadecabacter antarcticus 307]